MSALLWFHALTREVCEHGVDPVPGERDSYTCRLTGVPVDYQQHNPMQQPIDMGFMSLPLEIQHEVEQAAFRDPLALSTFESDAVHAVQRDDFGGSDATLRQVGWYCAGQHKTESGRGLGQVDVRGPSLLMVGESQCEHAVPVFVVIKVVPDEVFPVPPGDTTHPEPDFVQNMVGELVIATTNSNRTFTGKLTLYADNMAEQFIEIAQLGGGVKRIEWENLRILEPWTP